jgi:hypothetical protein
MKLAVTGDSYVSKKVENKVSYFFDFYYYKQFKFL